MYYGQKTILRGLELSDVDPIVDNFNNLELRNYLLGGSPMSREEEIDWIKGTWKRRREGSAYVFAIADFDDNFLGSISLENIHPTHKSAELGIAIYPKENWNKGYGSDAMISMCWIGFNIFNLNRIELEYHSFNERGARVYEKTGFKKVGVRRKAHFINGKYIDSVVMDILEEEFNQRFPDINLEMK